MQYIVHLSYHSAELSALKHTRRVEAATAQDAIEAALDACPTPGFFVVDHVEPVTPAQEN